MTHPATYGRHPIVYLVFYNIHCEAQKLHPSYWYNNFTKLCHTMLILAYRCTREYTIACLFVYNLYCVDVKHYSVQFNLFDGVCKIENWEPAYRIRYYLLSNRKQCKMWLSCCYARPQTSSLQTYGCLTVLTLIFWITGYVEYAVTCISEICLKTERWWTEVASNRSVVWHAASIADQAIDQWRVHLNACVKANGKHFENMLYDVLFHSCQ